MAGVKGRSGRPSNAERAHCRALIIKAVTDEDWQNIFHELAERAKEGSAAHAKLLLAYMYGVPAMPLDETDAEPFKYIAFPESASKP